MVVFGLLGHPRSHKGLRVRGSSPLLAAAPTTCHIDCVIADDASHLVAPGGREVLMRVGIRCNRGLRFQQGDPFRYAAASRRLYRLVRVGGVLGWAGIRSHRAARRLRVFLPHVVNSLVRGEVWVHLGP